MSRCRQLLGVVGVLDRPAPLLWVWLATVVSHAGQYRRVPCVILSDDAAATRSRTTATPPFVPVYHTPSSSWSKPPYAATFSASAILWASPASTKSLSW